jgi:hypothetical protein
MNNYGADPALTNTPVLASEEPAEQHSTIIEFPRGKYDPPKDEAEYLYRCPVCGEWVDSRNLGEVFDHEGHLPHPADDWRQRSLIAPLP